MTEGLVIELDARGLEPPEPLERTLQSAAGLAAGQSLHLLIHREPFPLYELLDGMGFRHETFSQANGDFLVIIRRGAANRPT